MRRSSGMRKISLIAWRDFRFTALTPAFLLGVVTVPVLGLIGLLLYPILLSQATSKLEGALLIIEEDGSVAALVETILDEGGGGRLPKELERALDEMPEGMMQLAGDGAGMMQIPTEIEIRSTDEYDRLENFKNELRDGRYIAIAVIAESLTEIPPLATEEASDPDGSEEETSLSLLIPSDSLPQHIALLEQVLLESIIEARAVNAGYDYDEIRRMIESPPVKVLRMTEDGVESDRLRLRMIVPVLLMMLLWTVALTSGNYVFTTTIEEKSNKVMEVLLSAVSPSQLMAGKILGQAAVAALMLVMFGGIIVAGLIALALSNILSVQLILLSLAYFVIAYFTIATVMAAIGSAVSELRDAQALMTPVIVVLMMPLILYIPINNNPTSTLAVVTSMIPPLTPFVMPLRLAAAPEPLPQWEIILSLLIGTGSVVALLWITSRIFRVGVLMQGKPPSPLELLRWLRYR
ncbi:MAG TPA: hypothetical protein DCX60_10465 [Phycisphaerales bacterium]|nr:hypothetical protein [Phycisphaerales bacterium]